MAKTFTCSILVQLLMLQIVCSCTYTIYMFLLISKKFISGVKFRATGESNVNDSPG